MIIDLMKKVNQDEKTTFLFSTHDPMITETVDHVIHILDGELEKIAAGVQ
jgi:putative ABC transport system ATP-binding protein